MLRVAVKLTPDQRREMMLLALCAIVRVCIAGRVKPGRLAALYARLEKKSIAMIERYPEASKAEQAIIHRALDHYQTATGWTDTTAIDVAAMASALCFQMERERDEFLPLMETLEDIHEYLYRAGGVSEIHYIEAEKAERAWNEAVALLA